MKLLYQAFLVFIVASYMAAPIAAQDDGQSDMVMVTRVQLDSAKLEQWANAWEELRDTALANGYSFPTYLSAYRDIRWMVTPISSYGDIDAVYKARSSVYEAGGEAFADALERLQDAEISTHTSVARYDPDLSYHHSDWKAGDFMNIDTVYFKANKADVMRDLLAEYKTLAEEMTLAGGYEVYWNALGSEGSSVTFVSEADSPADYAIRTAANDEMVEKDERMGELFARFLKIAKHSEEVKAFKMPEMSLIPK